MPRLALARRTTSVYTEYVFEWDLSKASANLAKHAVSFEEATTVFMDDRGMDGPDLLHSKMESRFLRLGKSAHGMILIVAYTKRRTGNVETIRLISARKASRKERTAYEATKSD